MLVGISGKAGAGKDTIGDHLVSQYGFCKIALADPIKRLVQDVFVLDDKTVYDRVEREKPLEGWSGWSVRKLLQIIGTELFRKNIDEEVWVKSLWYRVSKNKDKNYVVNDVRFPNELNFLKQNYSGNFLSIKVIRKEYDGKVGIVGHESEKYDLDTDMVINNNGTIEDLQKKIDALIKFGSSIGEVKK
jgi:dephospho-CoA kinase